MNHRSVLIALLAGAFMTGCVSTYQLTLMPRNSGSIYQGEAIEEGAQAKISIAIEGKTYEGTWVTTAADRSTGYVFGGFGGRRIGVGGTVAIENPSGGEAKALLRAADGSGLRCDFKGMSGRTGGGTCQDDKGLIYDVQIRAKESK